MVKFQEYTKTIDTDINQLKNLMDDMVNYIENVFSKEDVFKIRLVASELLMNAFKHGNLGMSNKNISLKIEKIGNDCEVCVKDQGDGLDKRMLKLKRDYLINKKSSFEESGRGLIIVLEYANEVKVLNHGRTICVSIPLEEMT